MYGHSSPNCLIIDCSKGLHLICLTFIGTVEIHTFVHIYVHICMLTYTEIGVYIHKGRSMSGHTLYLYKEFWIKFILHKWKNKLIFFLPCTLLPLMFFFSVHAPFFICIPLLLISAVYQALIIYLMFSFHLFLPYFAF